MQQTHCTGPQLTLYHAWIRYSKPYRTSSSRNRNAPISSPLFPLLWRRSDHMAPDKHYICCRWIWQAICTPWQRLLHVTYFQPSQKFVQQTDLGPYSSSADTTAMFQVTWTWRKRHCTSFALSRYASWKCAPCVRTAAFWTEACALHWVVPSLNRGATALDAIFRLEERAERYLQMIMPTNDILSGRCHMRLYNKISCLCLVLCTMKAYQRLFGNDDLIGVPSTIIQTFPHDLNSLRS